MTVRSHEDLEVWRKARVLARTVYQVTDRAPIQRDFPLRDQIRRAAISVLANITEGFARNGDREFLRFLGYSRGSLAELGPLLVVAHDTERIAEADVASCRETGRAAARLIAALMRYLRANPRPPGPPRDCSGLRSGPSGLLGTSRDSSGPLGTSRDSGRDARDSGRDSRDSSGPLGTPRD